jgi:hypothetical protein
MGNDGLLFKRYLLSDPFNPVSLRQLIGLSLWKVAFFYLFALTVVISLFDSRQSRRVLGLLVVNSVPVIGFAIFFAGSDIERYLALYPLMFLSISISLSTERALPIRKAAVLAFIAVMIVTNSTAMAKSKLDRKQEASAARIRDLVPRLDGRTMVFVANWQDELINFRRAYPFHPINRGGHFHLDALVTPGTSENLHWREDFAWRTLSTWSGGGAVWISRRVLSVRPRAEWNWCEGDDRRVSWRDFKSLFSQLEIAESIGGEDGFMRLSRSSRNEQFLSRLRDGDMKAAATSPVWGPALAGRKG